jgi:hypothetical protein
MRRVAEGEYSFAERDIDRLGADWANRLCQMCKRLSKKRDHLVPAAHGPLPHMSQFTLSDLVPQIPIWTANEWNLRYLFEGRMNGTKNVMASIT